MEKINLEVILVREAGKCSTGLPVTFSATQMQDGSAEDVGRFIGIPAISNSDQRVTGIEFRLDTQDAITGEPINLQVESEGDVKATVTLIVNNI